MDVEQVEQIEIPPVPEPKKRKREVGTPTHQEFDWFDRHVGLGFSQYEIAAEDGVSYEDVVKSVRYVARWMRKNFTDAKKYEIARSKNLYRLEKVVTELMKIFIVSSDVQAAKELRMCIHEWMEITGGLEPKKIETTSSTLITQVNGSIERLLQTNTPINPQMLEAAKTVRNIESQVSDVA